RMELLNPRIGNQINGWLEASTYGFTEHKHEVAGSQSATQEGALNATLATGVAAGLTANATQAANQARIAGMKSMWTTYGTLHKAPWLSVRADAIIHISVRAGYRLGPLQPGYRGTVRLAFRLADAMDLLLSPMASLKYGLLHQHGMPTDSGYY